MEDNPNYSYISTIITPDNQTHYIKDAEAREAISKIGSPMHFKGTKANLAEIQAVTSADIGDIWLALDTHTEYVATATITVATPSVWERIGSTEGLGALAFKDSATGTVSITPSGTVSTPTITVTPSTTTVNSIEAVGTLPTHAADTFTANTLPTWSASVNSEVLTFSFNAGTQASFTQGAFTQGTLPTKGDDTTVATGIESATSTQPTFTGTPTSVSVTVS